LFSQPVNGHEWAKRQAAAAGIGFTALSNGLAFCDDPTALQQICDRFGPGAVQVWFERWMARIPLPLTSSRRPEGRSRRRRGSLACAPAPAGQSAGRLARNTKRGGPQ
jgi:hypothetical protein